MKKLTSMFIIISYLLVFTSCSIKKQENKNIINKTTKINKSKEVIKPMKAIINNKEYNITLENNDTVKEFTKLLPLNITMNELNGNEKYTYIDKSLTTNSYNPKHINTGDVMLFGNNCLVLFYKSFDTSYSYTKIGHIDNLSDLGDKDITIKFEQ